MLQELLTTAKFYLHDVLQSHTPEMAFYILPIVVSPFLIQLLTNCIF